MWTALVSLGFVATGTAGAEALAVFRLESRMHEARATLPQLVESGILDEDEVNRFFLNRWSTEGDLATIEARRREMKPDCPLSCYRHRLPPPDFCYQQAIKARKYRLWLESQLEWAGPVEQRAIKQLIWETEWRQRVWDTMADINWPSWTPTCGRRILLQRLRDDIGVVAFERGDWPAPLPDLADWYGWEEVDEYEGDGGG